MPDWSLSNWAAAAIVSWPISSTSIHTPWPGGGNSYWLRTWKWTAHAEPAAGASLWKKNARNNRCHRDSSGARYRWRSHHRAEMDPQDDREDRRGPPADRHSRLGQHGRTPSLPDAFL